VSGVVPDRSPACEVSTRKGDELMKALGLDGVSKSEVSRICEELDPLEWRRPPIPKRPPQLPHSYATA
jgi:transposase-like protein